jgi:hypothetical protein
LSQKSDAAEFIRTLVRGDFEANSQYEQRLEERAWVGFPKFLTAVFFLAVDRRFGNLANQADIIKFVADLRGRGTGDVASLDPQATETLIRAVLDPAIAVKLDQTTMARIQTLVAHKILTDEVLSDEQLDALLAQAEQLANRRGDSNPQP